MKKVIAVLLILVMIFSLTSCGKLSAQGQKVTAVITGMNSKKLKLNMQGELLEGTLKTITVPTGDGGAAPIAAEIVKDEGEKTVIIFTGNEAGSGEVLINCVKETDPVCSLTLFITVDSKNKLNCTMANVHEGEFLYMEPSGDNAQEAKEVVRIPNTGASTDLIQLKNMDGEWNAVDFDDTIVELNLIPNSEDGYTRYQIIPLAEGESEVQFVNVEMMKQVVAKYVAISDGDGGFTATLDDYMYLDFTAEEYAAKRNQKAEERKIQVFNPNFSIPSECIIKGYSLYNAKTMAYYQFEEGKSADELTVPKNADTISVDLEYRDSTMECIMSNKSSLKDYIKQVDSMKMTETVEDIQFGAYQVKYYQMQDGFGIALWEDNGYAVQMTFTSAEQTSSKNKTVLNNFLK